MSDLQKYIERRKQRDPEFAKGYEEGYDNFKKCAPPTAMKRAAFISHWKSPPNQDTAQSKGKEKSGSNEGAE
jgi:hypothetical protein